MPRIQHNKLIRDRIPAIIEQSGKTCKVKVLNQGDYLKALKNKLGEELAEYRSSGDPSELADLLEVIYTIARAEGLEVEELEAMRANKCRERGSFDQRLLLCWVEE